MSGVPGSGGTANAWYHADFCHAYAWVYEEGDHLRVKWGERERENLYLHARDDCTRCKELSRDRRLARHGEFTMAKPDAKFSSTEAFLTVLAEIAEYVPGLLDETTSDAAQGVAPTEPSDTDTSDRRNDG